MVLLEHLRRGFRHASDVERHLSLPAIGSLPDWRGKRWLRRAKATTRLIGASPLVHSPSSPYANGIQSVHAKLRRTRSAYRSDVLVVLSALPGEGKSAFACNLAVAAAKAGSRTLLIDGDPYAASVTATFAAGPGGRRRRFAACR